MRRCWLSPDRRAKVFPSTGETHFSMALTYARLASSELRFYQFMLAHASRPA